MMEIKRHGAATYSMNEGRAQLQTTPMTSSAAKSSGGRVLEISVNDSKGTFDAETGVAGASVGLDREGVKALVQACLDFLVAT